MITKNEPHNFTAGLICAPDEYLLKLEEREFGEYKFPEDSLWIWPVFVTRGHISRLFTLGEAVKTARLFLVCDNKFSAFVNGEEIEAKKRGEHWIIDENIDSGELFKVGENCLALRLFQSASLMKLNSGVRGALTLTLAGGDTVSVPTDERWKSFRACGFFEDKEVGEWYGTNQPKGDWKLFSGKIHSRYNTRSCKFKRVFSVNKPIVGAALYITARGLYEARLNGELFDDGMFLPGSMAGCTDYSVFDLSGAVRQGENELCVLLGSGWLNSESWGSFKGLRPALLAELVIEYEGGECLYIGTDEDWQITASCLVDNDLQYGERYDARIKEDAWTYAAKYTQEIPPLRQADYPPVRIKSEKIAETVRKIADKTYLYDFSVNGAGRAKITLKNTKAGEVIKIRYAEMLDKNGLPVVGVYQDVFFPSDSNLGADAQYAVRNLDVYICKGADTEEYYPRFAYTGYRYIYIEGYSGEHTKETVKALRMGTDLEESGKVSTTDDDIMKIFYAVKRSYESNAFTGPTDCPTREKNFWNGDIQGFVNTALWLADSNKFLSRWTECGRKMQYGIYGWEDEEYILPLALYKFYGNLEVVKAKYPTVLALIKKREGEIPAGSVFPLDEYSPYRDHEAVENVPPDFYGALYFTNMYKEASRMASLVGDFERASSFEKRFCELRKIFNDKYYLDAEADYTPHCQGGIVLPVAFGIAREESIPRLMKTLHGYVLKADWHFTTGFMSSEHILGLLCDFGYSEDAYKLIKSNTYPSILDMLNSGASTTTENWRGQGVDSPFVSMNHYAFGSFARWFFEHLGGIKITSPAFSEVTLAPVFIKSLGDFKAEYKTNGGTLSTAWKYIDGGKIEYRFSIPKGTVAKVRDNAGEYRTYTEGDYTVIY